MIDVLFEQHVIQNTGLAAEAIWQAVYEAYDAKGRSEGVPFPLAFLVLPLAFHQRSASTLSSKTQPGALYKALADDREITVGLQARMEALADRTFQALSIAFHTGLLTLDSGSTRDLFPGKKTPPVTHVTEEVKTILNAAKRVGRSFAEMNAVQLAVHLNIRF
ncbi:MAG TPA: three component ABC system middle component [Candidatus Acidoferrales bacterium]|nr:three component ABC system middle component [Candidatus Acidoferrales bacterium]